MFLNFKRLVFIRKSSSLLALTFFALFTLLLSPATFAMKPDMEAVIAHNAKEIEEVLSRADFDIEAVKKLLLEKKLDVDGLLEIAVTQGLLADDDVYGKIFRHFHLSNQVELIDFALKNGARFSNISIVKHVYTYTLPSLNAATLMLENPIDKLDPSKFLDFVLRGDCSTYNSEKHTYEVDSEQIAHRDKLINLALGKKADPQKISGFHYLPSLELSQSLLKHGLDPNKFLCLILQIHCAACDLEKRLELVNLAFDRGANSNKIDTIHSLSLLPKICELLLERGLDPSKFLNLVLRSYQCDEELNLKLANLAFARGADANKIDGHHRLLSPKIYNLLLEQGLDPSIFLNLVLRADCTIFNPEKLIWEMDSKQTTYRDKLVNLAFDKGAKPQKVDITAFNHHFPSPELRDLLFEHGLDPSRFLSLIFIIETEKYDHKKDSRTVNDELVRQKNVLIKWAMDRGGKFSTIAELIDMKIKERLEKGLEKDSEPNEFVVWIIRTYNEIYDSTEIVFKDSDKLDLTKLKDSLIDIAIKYGADPNHHLILFSPR